MPSVHRSPPARIRATRRSVEAEGRRRSAIPDRK